MSGLYVYSKAKSKLESMFKCSAGTLLFGSVFVELLTYHCLILITGAFNSCFDEEIDSPHATQHVVGKCRNLCDRGIENFKEK